MRKITGREPDLAQATGGSVFDPKHSRRFSEFVVDDSSHVNLQRLEARVGSIVT